MRFFNTEGPVNCADHYCLPPLARLDLDDVMALIAQRKYFLLHAPRQTGKTTCLIALADFLNRGTDFLAVYANIETAQAARENVEMGMADVVWKIALAASQQLGDATALPLAQEVRATTPATAQVETFLARFCERALRPVVLLLDEVDALVGDTLIALLRQLRSGYANRPASFPQSLILCGVRDLQDYRIQASREKSVITGGSAFNIKAKSLRLGDFIRPEVETLLLEHTQETGQVFTPAALDLVWELTQGQPWLVNALAYETTWDMKAGRDRSRPVTGEMIQQAKENLILRRVTHLDQLADKLQEPRVRRVVEALLVGDREPSAIPPDDLTYVRDLGLVKTEGQLAIANPIYQEVIPRELTFSTQLTISEEPAWYIRPDGRLDLPKLLAAFQQFFWEHSESWLERFDYKEAGPQLLMQAFLQRIVNGGGRVDREYGLGRRRTDLLVVWNYPGGVQRAVIELKLVYGSLAETLAAGLAQTWAYADASGAEEAHLVLVIFDRTPGKPWAEKIWRRQEEHRGTPITVWGM
jgi:type II secretory pathway predicted ATPase ExeA